MDIIKSIELDLIKQVSFISKYEQYLEFTSYNSLLKKR